MPGLIALLTDFGDADPFAGIMKGVILSRDPKARIVDLTHRIPPHDVRAGAFQLMIAAPYFPKGTLFVCVVDPGVGSARRVLWARSRTREFLAPDNGLLSWVERLEPFAEVREVVNRRLFLEPVSRTFHGRDVFAPVAAARSRGAPPRSLGPHARGIRRLRYPEPAALRGGVRGEIVVLDRFGNAITNLRADGLPRRARLRCRGRELGPVRDAYAAAPAGSAVAVPGSSGFVELSVNCGSFAARYGARPGDAVEARNGA